MSGKNGNKKSLERRETWLLGGTIMKLGNSERVKGRGRDRPERERGDGDHTHSLNLLRCQSGSLSRNRFGKTVHRTPKITKSSLSWMHFITDRNRIVEEQDIKISGGCSLYLVFVGLYVTKKALPPISFFLLQQKSHPEHCYGHLTKNIIDLFLVILKYF